MRNDIAPVLLASFNSDLPAPGYLVRIDFTTPLRFSSRGPVLFGGDMFDRPAQVTDLTDGAGGLLSATVSLPNAEFGLNAYFANPAASPLRRRVRIWISDGNGPHAADACTLLIDGLMDAPRPGPVITFVVRNTPRGAERSPRVRLLPPLAEYLQAPGTIIDWDGERYVLEGSE
jgi:hypothetical protein